MLIAAVARFKRNNRMFEMYLIMVNDGPQFNVHILRLIELKCMHSNLAHGLVSKESASVNAFGDR